MKVRGFTLIEIIIIMVIITVLVAVSIPKFINLRSDARRATEMADARVVRGGISHYYGVSMIQQRDPPYPAVLDDVADGTNVSNANPFFSNVLNPPGVKTGGWFKIDNANYRGPTGNVYTYDNTTGSFSD